jgi:hypothetical protein
MQRTLAPLPCEGQKKFDIFGKATGWQKSCFVSTRCEKRFCLEVDQDVRFCAVFPERLDLGCSGYVGLLRLERRCIALEAVRLDGLARGAFASTIACVGKRSEKMSACVHHFVLHSSYEAPASVAIVITTQSIPTQLLTPAHFIASGP